jgi:hypothetical protein
MSLATESVVPASGDTVSGARHADHRYSTGRLYSDWIQAPLSRAQSFAVAPTFTLVGPHYAAAPSSLELELMRNELAEWRYSAAASFWAFEDALPEE